MSDYLCEICGVGSSKQRCKKCENKKPCKHKGCDKYTFYKYCPRHAAEHEYNENKKNK